MILIPLVIYPKGRLLNHLVVPFLISWENSMLFYILVASMYIPSDSTGFLFLHILTHDWFLLFLFVYLFCFYLSPEPNFFLCKFPLDQDSRRDSPGWQALYCHGDAVLGWCGQSGDSGDTGSGSALQNVLCESGPGRGHPSPGIACSCLLSVMFLHIL